MYAFNNSVFMSESVSRE